MVSKKRNSIDILFNKLLQKNPKAKVIEFTNKELKLVTQDTKFMNQFDATKFDCSEILPETLKNNGFFIVHLGKGNHAFVKGEGYHKFEKITKIKNITVKKGIIDEIGNSEAAAVSFIYNEGIIQDFLGIKDLKVHTARRSKVSFSFKVNGSKLHADNQQIEIDGIFETKNGMIVTVEAKNVEHLDFEIRQLFSIKKYFDMLMERESVHKNTNIRFLFLLRLRNKKKNLCRLYEYRFTDNEDINSIKFVQGTEYRINTGSLKKFM